MSALDYKTCTDCNCNFLTYANKPYCRNCIRNHCALADYPCDDGRYVCNCTFGLTQHRGEQYCLGHFKTLQNFCAHCGIPRPDACTDFQHDHMWYCPDCRFDFKREIVESVLCTLQKHMCNDIVIEILKKVVVHSTYRYPDTFNIPLRRNSLKQSTLPLVKES